MTTMAKNVRKIEPTAPVMSVLDLQPLLKKKRVAAYARVSTEKDEQQNSYDAQIDYYTTLIRNNPEWEFVDIYSEMYTQKLIQINAVVRTAEWLETKGFRGLGTLRQLFLYARLPPASQQQRGRE